MAAFVDAEHALDAAYAQKLGVDIDNLLVSQPDNGEQALEIVEVLIRSNGVDVVVVDSVAALVPKAEIEGEMGDAQMGLQARLMSQALRKLTGAVSKSKTCLIFINQLREKIGVMFGNPETTTGGRALKFYASVRMDIRRIASIKDGDVVVGGRTRVKVVKNKVAPPFREAEFDVMYGEGISKTGDLLDLAVDKRIIEKSGAWFAYGGERLGQGRENAKQFLKDNPEIYKAIEERVRRELGLTREAAAAVAAALQGRRSRLRGSGRARPATEPRTEVSHQGSRRHPPTGARKEGRKGGPRGGRGGSRHDGQVRPAPRGRGAGVRGVVPRRARRRALHLRAARGLRRRDAGLGYTDDLPLWRRFQLAVHDVGPKYIRDLKTEGYDKLTLDQIQRAKTHGVTIDYIQRHQGRGLPQRDAREPRAHARPWRHAGLHQGDEGRGLHRRDARRVRPTARPRRHARRSSRR